jgi:hypothetical protein
VGSRDCDELQHLARAIQSESERLSLRGKKLGLSVRSGKNYGKRRERKKRRKNKKSDTPIQETREPKAQSKGMGPTNSRAVRSTAPFRSANPTMSLIEPITERITAVSTPLRGTEPRIFANPVLVAKFQRLFQPSASATPSPSPSTTRLFCLSGLCVHSSCTNCHISWFQAVRMSL